MESVPWMTGRMRSRPAPVSILGRGRLVGGTVAVAVVLHEHQVPDLHEPLRPTEGRSPFVAVAGSLVEEELRTRAAWAGIAHLPEVVVAEALDPLRRDADDVAPDLFGLVVGLEHRDPHPVAVDAENLGDQFPGEGYGLGLEVVAEAEVAEHLEERAVALGRTHYVDVHGPEALLDRCGPRPRWHLVPEEERLERHHAGDGEEYGRVVRNQTGRRHGRVAALGEEPGEGTAEVIGVGRRGGGHDLESYRARSEGDFAERLRLRVGLPPRSGSWWVAGALGMIGGFEAVGAAGIPRSVVTP